MKIQFPPQISVSRPHLFMDERKQLHPTPQITTTSLAWPSITAPLLTVAKHVIKALSSMFPGYSVNDACRPRVRVASSCSTLRQFQQGWPRIVGNQLSLDLQERHGGQCGGCHVVNLLSNHAIASTCSQTFAANVCQTKGFMYAAVWPIFRACATHLMHFVLLGSWADDPT